MKIRLFPSFMATLLLAGCASLKIKNHPEAINVCPHFSENEDSLITVAYENALNTQMEKSSGFVKSTSCDSTSYPSLNLYYGRTFIAGKSERVKAAALSTVGIGAPIAMIASGVPFFIFWWANPTNQMVLTADLDDSLEIEDKKPMYRVNTTAWTGGKESQIERHSIQSGRTIGQILRQVKGKK